MSRRDIAIVMSRRDIRLVGSGCDDRPSTTDVEEYL